MSNEASLLQPVKAKAKAVNAAAPLRRVLFVSYPPPKGGGLGLVPVARLAPQDFYFFPALF
jgi:hypothetical protein